MNPYETLGISPEASPTEIRGAYRRLSMKHHPDRDGGDEDAFKEVEAAYSILKDPERRKQYDDTGYTGKKGPSPEDEVANYLRLVITQTMMQHDFDVKNYVELTTNTLKQSEGQCRDNLVRLDQATTKMNKLVENHQGDVFVGILQGMFSQTESERVAIDKNLKLISDALALLTDCEYSGPAELPSNFGRYTAAQEIYRDGVRRHFHQFREL